MQKWMKISAILFVTFLLVACVGESTSPAPCENTLVPIEVEFSWEPNEGTSEDEYLFKAIVTHEGINVDDADVQFEIWEHRNGDYHFMEETNHEGDGVYTLKWDFPKDGVYYAYYHVTACGMHRMEKEMVVVGDVNVEEITAEPDNVTGKMEHGHGDSHSEDEHTSHDEHEEETNE